MSDSNIQLMPPSVTPFKIDLPQLDLHHNWHALPPGEGGTWCPIKSDDVKQVDDTIFRLVSMLNPKVPPPSLLQMLIEQAPANLAQNIMDVMHPPKPIVGNRIDPATGKLDVIGYVHEDGTRTFNDPVPGTNLPVFHKNFKFSVINDVHVFLTCDTDALTNYKFGAIFDGLSANFSVGKRVNISNYPHAQISITGGGGQDGRFAFLIRLTLKLR